MDFEPVKVKVIDLKPTHVKVKILSNKHIIKMGKQFFQKRVKAGFFDVVNSKELASGI